MELTIDSLGGVRPRLQAAAEDGEGGGAGAAVDTRPERPTTLPGDIVPLTPDMTVRQLAPCQHARRAVAVVPTGLRARVRVCGCRSSSSLGRRARR
jgi:hypothetical protein